MGLIFLLYLCIVGISREVGEKKIMIYHCIFKSRYLYSYTVIAHICLAFFVASPPSFFYSKTVSKVAIINTKSTMIVFPFFFLSFNLFLLCLIGLPF